jgi:hypothetical protein
LKACRPWSALGSFVGRYYLVGPDRLVRANVDLTELAQELGCLANYEELADERTLRSESEWEQQVEAAVAAAPFVHPRLASVGGPRRVRLTSAAPPAGEPWQGAAHSAPDRALDGSPIGALGLAQHTSADQTIDDRAGNLHSHKH